MDDWPENSLTVKSKEGEVIPGIRIIPGFAEEFLTRKSVLEMFQELTDLPVHPSNEPIALEGPVHWIPGEHPALNYRGNALKRTKIWLQSNLSKGYLKYGYTGWQWKVARAQRDISSVPSIEQWMNDLNALGPFRFNHVIATLYKDSQDNIGDHSDKTESWEPNSWFCVVKMGDARPFTIKDLDGNVLLEQSLPAGTAVFVSTQANSTVKHGVPPTKASCGPSGSLVFRSIAETIPWSRVDQEIQKREERKNKKRAATRTATTEERNKKVKPS